ncbi:MAG: glycosyltransferase, partial [Bacteroidota bacterium]
MKIILTSIGTRGDMEPFLAIGEILKEKGHDVTCLFPEQFRSLAIDSGFEFESLGSKFIEMLDSPAGRIAM